MNMSLSEASPIQPMGHVLHQISSSDYLESAPYVEAQQELETLFNKNQRTKRIKSEFDIPLLQTMCQNSNMPYEFTLGLVTQMAIHRRTEASVLIGILHHHFEYQHMHMVDQMWVDINPEQQRNIAMQRCAEALESAIENDFVDYDLSRDQFVQKLHLTADTLAELDRYQYPLPMIVEPTPVTHNRENGYLSPQTTDSLVVLRGEKAEGFYEHNDVCLDHLNRVNQISLRLNAKVSHMVDNEWADLNSRRYEESQEDYEKRVKAFLRYDRQSKDVISGLSEMRDKFWLTHKYDRRGRVYCQGYHVNYQGNEWNKAVVEFANKEMISG